MLTINLFDGAFAHLRTPDGIYSAVHGQTPKHTRYVHDKKEWDGITIFTERDVINGIHQEVKSKYKIGWLIECSLINGIGVKEISNVINEYDYILTHDEHILAAFPNKTILVPLAGSWINPKNIGIHNKIKKISYVMSNKNFTDGHKLRHSVLSHIRNRNFPIDVFGRGINPINYKEQALCDYKYSIVIENTKRKNYFTEKIVDCFNVGTIPIYWGCPNIGDFFDEKGIIIVQNYLEIENIINTIKNSDYNINDIHIKNNLTCSKQYTIIEDWLYETVYKELL